MTEEITQIRIGDFTAGVIGLRGIFDKIKQSGISAPEMIKRKLVELARQQNYITDAVSEKYAEALCREYRKFLGEEVEDECVQELVIRVLGPGCPACEQMMEDVRSVLAELNLPADLLHVRNPNEIAQFGLVATPALVINNKLKISGRKAQRKQLIQWLSEAIKGKSNGSEGGR
jgi:small redox-active disulfide protein 2